MWLFGETKSKYDKTPNKGNSKNVSSTRGPTKALKGQTKGELREPAKGPNKGELYPKDSKDNKDISREISSDFEKDLPLKNLRPNDKRAHVKVVDGHKEIGRTTVTKTHQGSFWAEKEAPTIERNKKENFITRDESDSEDSEAENRITVLEGKCKTYEEKQGFLEERCRVLEIQHRDLFSKVDSLLELLELQKRQVPLSETVSPVVSPSIPEPLTIPFIPLISIPPQNYDNVSIPCNSTIVLANTEELKEELVPVALLIQDSPTLGLTGPPDPDLVVVSPVVNSETSVSEEAQPAKKEKEEVKEDVEFEVEKKEANDSKKSHQDGPKESILTEIEKNEVEVSEQERKAPVIGRVSLPPIRKQGKNTRAESPD